MIKYILKSILPEKVWNRLRLLREGTINRHSAERFFSEIIKKKGPVLTQEDHFIISSLPDGFSTVLEVGGGGGRLTYWLVHSGYKVTGIEPDPWYRNKVDQFIRTNLPKGELEISDGDIHNLNSGYRKFDVVICCNVIEHIDYPEKGVEQLIKAAKKNIIVTTPVGYCFNSVDHKHHFFKEDLKKLFDGYNYMVSTFKPNPLSDEESYLINVQKD